LTTTEKINIFWFRRDLRLEDNAGLLHALKSGNPVLPVFIFDPVILDDLDDPNDSRVKFIHDQLIDLNRTLEKFKTSILVKYDTPLKVFKSLVQDYNIEEVYSNEDYEPYAIERDRSVKQLVQDHGIGFQQFKDHVIFHKSDILNNSGDPYKVFSAYKRKWISANNASEMVFYQSEDHLQQLLKSERNTLPDLSDMGFKDRKKSFPDKKFDTEIIKKYDKTRNFPYMEGTTRLGVHFRHGTISVRKAVATAKRHNDTWLNELIWREFYSMILYHFPQVVTQSFKQKYDNVPWRNDKDDFQRWQEGKTGYPIVDAGMRQLNQSGYMHNRVRMITASFLTKHLLIDWRWGEAYFAKKLLDYDLASNNGGWQWAAGTGTDAQPYFRVFNPYEQTKKFDPEHRYIKQWAPEYSDKTYPKPIIDHKFARQRAIETYKKALG
jgi:deoxyribodipyrimidine photo-lyase